MSSIRIIGDNIIKAFPSTILEDWDINSTFLQGTVKQIVNKENEIEGTKVRFMDVMAYVQKKLELPVDHIESGIRG